jgi:hypothetical protein
VNSSAPSFWAKAQILRQAHEPKATLSAMTW